MYPLLSRLSFESNEIEQSSQDKLQREYKEMVVYAIYSQTCVNEIWVWPKNTAENIIIHLNYPWPQIQNLCNVVLVRIGSNGMQICILFL